MQHHFESDDRMDRRRALKTIAGSAVGTAVGGLALSACGSVRGYESVGSDTAVRDAIPREFRAAWVATVANIDWPSEPGLSAEVQRREIIRILDVAQRMELNAILLQVRPTCDALYDSKLEPWSAFLTGQQGKSPGYDPLAIWTREAHARGIDVHAWINPFRARHIKSIGPDAANHVVNEDKAIVREHRGYLWLDPGEPRARELMLRVVEDLLARYELDGVHVDDYFYPYPEAGKPFPDAKTYERYTRLGGRLSINDWRRENINSMVRDLNSATHAGGGSNRLFTVSPFGIWRPGHPEGIQGFDAYEGLFADAKRWLNEGWCDAMMPQLYWPIESKGQPFEPLLDWWVSQNRMDRHVWPGLYLTRIRPMSEGAETGWKPKEIVDQIQMLRRKPGATGFALFSMVGMTDDHRGVAGVLRDKVFSGGAVPPETGWIGARSPGRPTTARARLIGTEIELELEASSRGPSVRRYAVGFGTDGGDGVRLLAPGDGRATHRFTPSVRVTPSTRVMVTPIGANGKAGTPVSVSVIG